MADVFKQNKWMAIRRKKKSKTKHVKNLTQIMDLSTTYNYKISRQKQMRFPL